MTIVKFGKLGSNENEYIFTDSNSNEYILYSEFKFGEVLGVDPFFWENFYFCNKIEISYVTNNEVRVITRVKIISK